MDQIIGQIINKKYHGIILFGIFLFLLYLYLSQNQNHNDTPIILSNNSDKINGIIQPVINSIYFNNTYKCPDGYLINQNDRTKCNLILKRETNLNDIIA